MNRSHLKVVVVVFVLFLLTGFVTVGCKKKVKNAWVNTKSMPGSTFKHNNAGNADSRVVYLGSDKDSPNVNFGPSDVSFEFRDLNR